MLNFFHDFPIFFSVSSVRLILEEWHDNGRMKILIQPVLFLFLYFFIFYQDRFSETF